MPYIQLTRRAAFPLRCRVTSNSNSGSLVWRPTSPALRPCRRGFSTTFPFHLGRNPPASAGRNHYETLNVARTASPAEIKKSFYALSKKCHPDHHPDNPTATARFHALSEAYSILGTPAKRAAYDRDLNRLSPSSAQAGGVAPRGSYHSSGHAGGRPATGLSRRRTPFRGPPPSFYKNASWHPHAHAHANGHGHGANSSAAAGGGGGGGGGGGTQHRPQNEPDPSHPEAGAGAAGWTALGARGGMGPGQDPFGHTLDGSMPHFDRAGHQRTQREQDRRRAWRAAGGGGGGGSGSLGGGPGGGGGRGGPDGSQESAIGGFFAVSSILVLTFLIPCVLFGGLIGGKRKERKTKKSRAG
ncbi:DnaJ-domain-containing protein [Sodiomyces alkalinus F11]|uniref:DnaJ-domain-containing protein n=1 Tax=Sodiomyces alkalinus (strain CBS 110278 / VKM F-3762 / F11) TaxID=1314773 RepID=A0A3N2Q3C3_SODAK|nr:DnaJ-domain-containing protein [Sodiomyces alkalinus F11]ROT41250.1 DnaJ-domain-containing protein [Sodiomyces alkalinus F11]